MKGGGDLQLWTSHPGDKKETHVSCQCLETIKQKLTSLSVLCFAHQQINKVLNPSGCPLTSRWFLLSCCRSETEATFSWWDLDVRRPDRGSNGLRPPPHICAHMVITQRRGRGRRSLFNQRANENMRSWKIKRWNYPGGIMTRSLWRKFMGAQAYLLISLGKTSDPPGLIFNI